MRVLYVSNVSPMGGANRSMCECITCIRECEATVAGPESGELRDWCVRHLVEYVPLPIVRITRRNSGLGGIRMLAGIVRTWFAIYGVCRRGRIRVLHANSTSAALCCLFPAILRSYYLVWHVRDRPENLAVFRVLGCVAAQVVVCSRFMYSQVEPMLPQHAKADLRILYNAPRTPRARKSGSCSWPGARRGRVLLLCASQLVPWKRLHDVISAMPLILQQEPSACLLHAGSDALGENAEYVLRIRHDIERLGVSRAVTLLGEQSGISGLLEECTLAVLVSENEPFGRFVVEAMLSGVPVIASKSGSFPELLKNGEAGFLVDLGNPPRLAEQVIWCLSNPEKTAAVASRGRAYAESTFSHTGLRAGLKQLYAPGADCSNRTPGHSG